MSCRCLAGVQAGCAPPVDIGVHAEHGEDGNMVPGPMGAALDRLGGRSPSGWATTPARKN